MKRGKSKTCPICEKTFDTVNLMKIHAKRRSLPCDFCQVIVCNDLRLNVHKIMCKKDKKVVEIHEEIGEKQKNALLM